MAPILLWLILVLCLLISAVKYLMGIILKFSFASTKAQKDYAYQPTVSVLMPCYNEGKTVYETIESVRVLAPRHAISSWITKTHQEAPGRRAWLPDDPNSTRPPKSSQIASKRK
jgi:hypothetical protein